MFENSNVGSDHQQLTMQIMQNVARRYGLVCLLHEKPFAGVNGSGKHNNWSMGTDTGTNLLEPGRHAAREPAVPVLLRGRHPGGQPAPGPAAGVGGLDRPGPPPGRQRGAAGDHLDLPRRRAGEGVRGDRGRRGGRGEPTARSSGSAPRCCRRCRCTAATATAPRRSRSPATSSSSARWARASRWRCPNTVLNTIVAEAIDELGDGARGAPGRRRRPRGGRARGRPGRLRATTSGSCSSGDNYSEEWHAEAEQRGLLQPAHDARRAAVAGRAEQTVEVFAHYDVLSERELESRYEVFVEQYATSSTSRPRPRPRSPAR